MEQAETATVPWRGWCSTCGKPAVRLEKDFPPVHEADGKRFGFDGHPCLGADDEPPLWAAARRVAGDYPMVRVTARFGILRADWRDLPPGCAAPPVTAPGEGTLRRKLDEALDRAST